MARKNFNPGTLTAPLPPALVSVGDGEIKNVLTVAWTGIVCSTPAMTYISVRPSRYSYEILKRTGEFVVNLAPDTLAKTVDYCGIYTGAKVDKFAKCGLSAIESKAVGAPTVGECPIALECRVTEVRPLGSHDMFLAEIVNVSVDESLLDEAGKIHIEKAHLLAYAHGDYFALGKCLGHFGFSAAKKKKTTAKKPPRRDKK